MLDRQRARGRASHVLRRGWAFLPLALLAACGGPSMNASRTLGRGIIIENTDTEAFTINRIIANGSAENGNCNNYPNRTLAPGSTYTVVFWLCGNIQKIEVQTDRGTSFLEWG